MYHVPMCLVCQTREVGTFLGSDQFCSAVCEAEAQAELEAYRCDYPEDGEPQGSYDLSDDAEALASVGFGSAEDYGYGNDADITCWEFDG